MLKKKKRTAGALLAAFTLSTLVAVPALAVEGDPYDNVAQAWQDFNDGTIDSQGHRHGKFPRCLSGLFHE